MLKHVFDNAREIAAYPVFSLLVFFVFFIGVAVWLVKANKKHMDEMSRLPLDQHEQDTFNS